MLLTIKITIYILKAHINIEFGVLCIYDKYIFLKIEYSKN